MMDYQTQRRFGKRAKIHANDDTNGSVHSKNKISVFFLNIPKLSFRLKYEKKFNWSIHVGQYVSHASKLPSRAYKKKKRTSIICTVYMYS